VRVREAPKQGVRIAFRKLVRPGELWLRQPRHGRRPLAQATSWGVSPITKTFWEWKRDAMLLDCALKGERAKLIPVVMVVCKRTQLEGVGLRSAGVSEWRRG
jgi:hypothetical protein